MKILLGAKKTVGAFKGFLSILIAMILLISLGVTAIPSEFYSNLFTGNYVVDSFIGSIIGSLAAGNPITSYVIGGELLSQGVPIVAVTAFILAWVTVGLVQLPGESIMLGKKFAVVRNIVNFVFSIIMAIFVSIIVGVLG